MKKIVLLAFVTFSFLFARADNKVYLQGYLYYNSTNHTIQVQYWICNPTTGNPNIDIASLTLGLRWDSTVVSFTGYSFFPSGSGLDASDYLSSKPDLTTAITPTTKYKGYNFQRSTLYCNNLVHLGNGQCKPFFQATFTISAALAGNYDYTNSSASNYIASFTGYSPANAPIQFVPGAQYDDAGNSGSCSGTVGTVTNIQTSSTTPPSFSNSNAPLPVKWLSFNVYNQRGKTKLIWETAAEINNSGFEIQKKVGDQFEKIGFVYSKASGNAAAYLSYEFTDTDNSTGGTVYYRLKQIGVDNSVSYSEVKAVRLTDKSLQVLIYPNPSRGNVTVVLPADFGGVDMVLQDYSGKTLQVWNNYKTQQLSFTNLAKGFYLLQGKSKQTGETFTQKITVF
jgi:hypothetical protein